MSLKDILHKTKKNKSADLFYQQYIALGLYHDQVKRYLDVFGKEQVKIFLYEDIINDIDGVVKEIYNLLAVDSSYEPATEKKHNVFLAPQNPVIEKLYALKIFRTIIKEVFGEKLQAFIKRSFFTKEKKPQIDPVLKQELQDVFRDDVLKTAKLINKDLSHWL